jgi:hypothetical protein
VNPRLANLGRGFRLIACAILALPIGAGVFEVDRGIAELERHLEAQRRAKAGAIPGA